MKIEINIEKKHFYFLTALIVVLFFTGIVIAQVPSNPNPGHSASEVGPGTFSGTAQDSFVFPGKVIVGGNLSAGGWVTAKNGYGYPIYIGGDNYWDDFEILLEGKNLLSIWKPNDNAILYVAGKIYAGVDPKNPPHTCPQGWGCTIDTWDLLAQSIKLGGYLCFSDGSCSSRWPSLSCTTVTASCSGSGRCTAYCPAGYTVTGGGYSSWWGANVDYNGPYNNGWHIDDSSWSSGHDPWYVYAICCKLQY